MSQQSNPATLRELWSAVSDVWAYCPVCDQANGKHCQHLEGCVLGAFEEALAASGTHSLPPSKLDGSMATASGVPNVGNEYTAGWTNGRLYEAELINEEYLDLGGWELVNKDKFEKHIESLKAVVRLTNEHGPIGAVAMNEEAPQGLQKASPEGEGREALERSMVALDDWLNIHAPDHCDEQRVKEARQRVNEHGTIHYIGTVQDRNRAASRQSAAPSGGDLREAVQDMMPLIEWYVKREIEHPANHQEFARQTERKLDRLRIALAQESKTGAVTDAQAGRGQPVGSVGLDTQRSTVSGDSASIPESGETGAVTQDWRRESLRCTCEAGLGGQHSADCMMKRKTSSFHG